MKRWEIYSEDGDLLYDDYYAPTKRAALEQFAADADLDLSELTAYAKERPTASNPPSGLATVVFVGGVALALFFILRSMIKASQPAVPAQQIQPPVAPGHTTT